MKTAFGLLLFGPAGTFDYWQAWVFIAVFTISRIVPSIYLLVTSPSALQLRNVLDHRFGVIPAVVVLAVRMLDEDRMLERELAGYREYTQKVRYPVVPYIW
jgi:hypothetical protein